MKNGNCKQDQDILKAPNSAQPPSVQSPSAQPEPGGEKLAGSRHSAQFDQTLFDQLPILLWHAGLDAQCDYFNPAWLAFTGRTLAEARGEGWIEGVHPEDRARCLQAHWQACNDRQPFQLEYRLRNARGDYRWILAVARPLTDAEGHFSGFVGVCYDLSEQKRLEQEQLQSEQEQLRLEQELLQSEQALETAHAAAVSSAAALSASEAMFKGLFEHAPDAIIAVGPDGRMLLANQQAERMFGYTRAELTGQQIEMLMPDAVRQIHVQHRADYMRDPRVRPMHAVHSALELVGQRKDGTAFPVEINLGPLDTGGIQDGGGQVILATIRDISARKASDAALKANAEAIREREKLLTTAAEAAPVVFFKMDREGIIQFSLGISLARRLTSQETVGRSIYDLYGDFPNVIECFERALEGETLTTVVEAGGLVYEASYAPMQNEQGEITSVVGVASDVTRHRLVENALEESEAHFRMIFDNAILGVFLIDPHGRIVETNRALQQMLGYSSNELNQRKALDLLHPRELIHARERIERIMNGDDEHLQVEQRYLRKDGTMMWGRLAMSLFRGQDGKPVYGIGMVENITAQKQAEAELAELRRRLIDSAELERRQLSQDLHDGPLQDLQAMIFQISLIEGLIADAEGQKEVEALREELARVVRSIRAVCGDLRPPALAPFGLEKAIRSHAEQFREQHPELAIHLDLAQDNQALSERVRLALFRIYQHSLANILRHAQAHHVWIEFSYNDETIRLRIADDGKGFKVPRRWIELVRQSHFGVVGSIERAESVGGKLEIQSAPGQGTLVVVTVPRKEEEQVSAPERWSPGG